MSSFKVIGVSTIFVEFSIVVKMICFINSHSLMYHKVNHSLQLTPFFISQAFYRIVAKYVLK